MELRVFMSLKNQSDLHEISRIFDSKKVIEKGTHNLGLRSVREILPFLKDETFCYIKSRENNWEYLAIGKKDIHDESTDITFGAIPFSKNQPSYIFSPKFFIKRNNKGTNLYINETLTNLDFSRYFLTKLPQEKSFKSTKMCVIPTKETWVDNINQLKSFFTKDIGKVVLSRKITFDVNSTSINNLISNLTLPNQPTSYEYILNNSDQFFYSVSPECLFKTNKNEVIIDAIAGTCNRGKEQEDDKVLFHNLVNDPKERKEHLIVCDYIKRIATELDLELSHEELLRPLQLKYIQHIYSKFTFNNSRKIDPFYISKFLHPTPAVAGTPTATAMKIINNIEESERGFYSGALFVNDPNDDMSEFIVGIRSFRNIKQTKTIEIFGGAGILPESSPESEWEETANKMKNFTTKLKEILNENQ